MRRVRTELGVALLLAGASLACRQDMHDQPRYEPLEASRLFKDGRAARPLVEGTVARGHLALDEHLLTGRVQGQPAETFPFEVTREVMERGRQRFDIFCSPCHDKAGTGRGIVVRRGLKAPPSFHEKRLRESPPGYFVDVMTNGFGVMVAYDTRVPPRDRWAIAAYIRALQRAQAATLDDVPDLVRPDLEETRP